MTGRIAIFSPGLKRLSSEIRALSGLEPHFALASARGAEAVAGWGHKPTARRAREIARRAGLPYVAFEDGFLRSLRPGTAEPPSSLVMDRSGIYYDSSQPSDLETLLETASFAEDELRRARDLQSLIASSRLSKYNAGVDRLDGDLTSPGREMVLLVDQTFGDQSVAGALSDATTFEAMARAAVSENPGARIVARLHPETVSGAKRGYLADLAARLGLGVLADAASPWCLFDLKPKVYTVSSQFGFEAALAGCEVHCFGLPFYAGWGLTRDRMSSPRRTARRSATEIAAAVYLRYCRYFDCWRRTPVEAETAVEQLAFLRRSFLGNARPVVGYRIARWKRKPVSAMLDGPHGPPRYVSRLGTAMRRARQSGAAVAAWGIAAVRLRPQLAAAGIDCIAVEDGFLRSVGLGAAFVTPLSLVFDRTGLYFDPTRPSDIETMLAAAEFTAADLARARALRERIRAARLTKYNLDRKDSPLPAVPGNRVVILVPGQVADDWAVLTGRPYSFAASPNINATLLERVRKANPGAFVIFRPHPDVERLGRAGALDEKQLARDADAVACDQALDDLLPLARQVETYSSLAGFEALLRGIPVTVHGVPFFAGWGLTEDRAPTERRGRQRSLDELVAAALIHYPRYWDPVSGRVCPPEVALERLAEAREKGSRGQLFGVFAGRAVIAMRRVMKSLKRPGRVSE